MEHHTGTSPHGSYASDYSQTWLATKKVVSPFVRFLELVFRCDIDVQVGNGRLNYINGYVSKDHDAVDVGLGEYAQKGATAPWLAAYRLL